ncbi:hypothetical protein I302_104061 [Kwoniella bestiolae CBS 10118]|uniref:Uncharacterized protein n=1 Tax=Kwoniella bestiolae CBS 10118 TaxID=1296100 RepID=A0A1B9GA79_9TREE|nr:hypothetical protein I302_02766 [Kwoniella bestiolae CBS 10118]OCF27916.1 hypothetical protein I302_02766 [Kwoniella bestiolae CBS 10118]
MSSSADIPIDPSLQQLPSATSPTSKTGGTKRKTRASGPSTSTSTSPRVTRRSNAQIETAPSGLEGGEPARGEEENLNGYWGPSSSKRARRSSPTKRSKPSAAQHETAGGTSRSEGGTRRPSIPGVEDSASAATPAKRKSSGIFPYFPLYPVGLTPFRYPCLTPSQPNPPAGDPNDPNFKPFNPHAPETTTSHPAPPPSQPIDPQLSGSSVPQPPQHSSVNDQPQAQDQIPHPHLETTGSQSQVNTMMDQNTAASADAAYESISALLSASQGVYPTLDSIDYGPT